MAADLRLPRAAAAGETTQYGHIKSLRLVGARYVLRFDPALWLGGVTAERAAVQDGAIRPGQPVPNDYYIVDEGHRLLSYHVPATLRPTILTRGTCTTRTTVAALARSAPAAGFWIRVRIDTVRSLDQQYRP